VAKTAAIGIGLGCRSTGDARLVMRASKAAHQSPADDPLATTVWVVQDDRDGVARQ
jgi:hypothetical protein